MRHHFKQYNEAYKSKLHALSKVYFVKNHDRQLKYFKAYYQKKDTIKAVRKAYSVTDLRN